MAGSLKLLADRSNAPALPLVGTDVDRVFSQIAFLEADYPGFADWYWNKVVPESLIGTSRRIRSVMRDGEIVGVSIAKKSDDELKLCTVWVAEDWQGSGMGARLMLEAMDWLGTRRPLATVSEARMPLFAGVMSRLGYEVTQILDGYYRPGGAEYVYNGALLLNG